MSSNTSCPSFAIPELQSIPSGMLSSPQIKTYFDHNFLIVDPSINNLKGATYDMRLGVSAYRFVNGNKEVYNLSEQDDANKSISKTLEFPPNSLTFITTLEEFKLPQDVIARYNLKSKFVHKGLLLGTGPIVDPEFEGHLFIPVHNFSASTVYVDFCTSIIVVEFTKTLSTQNNYIPNPSKNGDLKRYLETAGSIESSVYAPLLAYKQEIKENSDARNKWNKRFTYGGVISAVATFIALTALLFTTWSTHTDTQQKILAAHEALTKTSLAIKIENENLRKTIATLEEQIKAMASSLANEKALKSHLPLGIKILNPKNQNEN